MSTDQEIPICAAMQMDDGYVIRGHRHDDCMQTMGKIPRYKGERARQEMQGFVTSRNRFVGREEACRMYRAANMRGPHGELPYNARVLFSEDLY